MCTLRESGPVSQGASCQRLARLHERADDSHSRGFGGQSSTQTNNGSQ